MREPWVSKLRYIDLRKGTGGWPGQPRSRAAKNLWWTGEEVGVIMRGTFIYSGPLCGPISWHVRSPGQLPHPGFPTGSRARAGSFFLKKKKNLNHPLHLRLLRATSQTRLRTRVHFTLSTLIGGKGRADPSSLHTTLEGPAEWVCECKMDVKSTWIPYMASNGSCFMVSWTIFKNHLLEVALIQNRETMAL